MKCLVTQLAYVAIALGGLIGCKSPATPTAVEQDRASAIAEFKTKLATEGNVGFLSWNGKWIGMDGDTRLQFRPSGFATMTEYGYGVQEYVGTYQIDANNVVTLMLPDFKPGWPTMVLEKDATSLLLRPKDGDTRFIMGTRGGAVTNAADGSYWPFRAEAAAPTSQPK